MNSTHKSSVHGGEKLKKFLFAWFAVFLLQVPVKAEVAGTPAAPIPGKIPHFWARFGNDFFGIWDKNPDDFRTTQTIFGAQIGERLLATFDMSAFTDKGPRGSQPDPGSNEGRIDQVTISLARRWFLAARPANQVREFAWGLALRKTGDLNGAAVQNGLHEVINNNPVHLSYEDVNRLDVGPLASFNSFTYLDQQQRWGMWIPVQGLITTAIQGEVSAGAYGSFHSRYFTLWSGLRGELRTTGEVGNVIDNAFDQEEGTYYVLGFKMGPVAFDLGHKIGTDYGYGWLTLTEDHIAQSVDDMRGHDINLSVGAELPYFGVRTDLAWLAPTSWSGTTWRWGMTGVFSGGELPEDAPVGWDEYQRSLSLGPSLYYFPGWKSLPGASVTTNVRYGERREGFLTTQGPTNEKSVSKQDVIAGDVALVIALSGIPQQGLGLKLGVTAWKPLDGSEQVLLGSHAVTVMETEIVPFVSFDYGFSF